MSALSGHNERASCRFHAAIASVVLLMLLSLGMAASLPASAAADVDLQPGRMMAADAEDDVTWEYTLNSSGNAVITGYTLKAGVTEIDIPKTLDGHRVVEIVSGVFAGDTQLKAVHFSSSVNKLGPELFAGCTNLETVSLTPMEELREIPEGCFYGCAKLDNVSIPSKVSTIQANAFYGCAGLKTFGFNLAGDLSWIGSSAFGKCTALKSVDFPMALKTIDMGAFAGCEKLATVKFRSSAMATIGMSAFQGCTALQELHLPDRLASLSHWAFKGCTSLKTVAFGKQMPTASDSSAFEGCPIELMLFPAAKVKKGYEEPSDKEKERVGWKKNDTAWVSIIYDDNDTGNGDVKVFKFHATPANTVIKLPASIGQHDIVMIVDEAAWKETNLTQVVYAQDCKITFIDGWAFRECTNLRSVVIPSSVEKMDQNVFRDCTSLASVEFQQPSSLEYLAGSTFYGCTSLEEIELPEGMTTIYGRDFYNCTSLKHVVLPDTMQNIAANSFGCDTGKHMAIETMRMPNSAGELNVPRDIDFFRTWIVNDAKDTFKFKVTYGSTADCGFFEPHLHAESEKDRIELPNSDREYVAVEIGDADTHTQKANDVELVWDTSVNWTGDVVLPSVTATRWLRADPIGYPYLTVAPYGDDDCTTPGVHHAVVTGKAPYFAGYRIIEYQINKSNLDNVQMGEITPTPVWDDQYWTPDPDFYAARNQYAFLQGTGEDGMHKLEKGKDYEIVKYEHNKLGGQATIRIKGLGNFEGTKDFPFTIEPAELSAANVQAEVPDQVYTGETLTPLPATVKVKDRNGGFTVELNKGRNRDYVVDSYANNTNVGQATMTLKPVNNCTWLTGEVQVHFNIVQANLADATIEAVPDQTFTGSDIKPALKVSMGEGELAEGADYTVSWKNNKNVGTAQATVKAKGANCKGEKTIEFKIVPKPVTVRPNAASKTFGDADPKLTATVEGIVGGDNVVYSLARDKGENVGTYKIKASGTATQGNYAVTFKEGSFTIGSASITNATVSSIDAVYYDGEAQEPGLVVTYNGKALVKDTDYTLEYSDNTNAGQATVAVRGKGNFKDEVDPHFTILPLDLRHGGCEVFTGFQMHTGAPLTPHPARVTALGRDGKTLVLVENVDYKLYEDAWRNNVDVGTGYVKVSGIGNFCESQEGSFSILNNGDLGQGRFSHYPIPSQTYTGGPIDPDPHVELTGVDVWMLRDVDYTLSYENNVNVGTASVTAHPVAGSPWTGSVSGVFEIVSADLSTATVKAVPDQTYTGEAIEPALEVSLGAGPLPPTDYEVVWQDNVDVGTASGIIKGVAPNCTGQKAIGFTIVPKLVKVTPQDSGKEFGTLDPKLTATVEGLVGTDTVSYSLARDAGDNVGTYTIKATGAATQGNYAVSFGTGTFTVSPTSIANAAVAAIPDCVFDGSAHQPKPIVTWRGQALLEDVDYTVSYEDNTHAGTATATVNGKGNFKEAKPVAFTIDPLDLSSDGCEVVMPFVMHTGEPLSPHPASVTAPGRDGATLTLFEDADYTMYGWSRCIDVGTGVAIVMGAGDYCGERKGYFEIINDGDLSQGFIDPIPDQEYTGEPIEPTLHVYLKGVDMLLRRGVDYEAVFEDNVEPGMAIPGGYARARVTVTGIGALHGELKASFRIKPPLSYTLVKGPSGPVKQGTGAVVELEFKRSYDDDTTLDHLTGVLLNGEELPASAYDTRRGSAIITLKTDYIDSLTPGEFTLTAVFDDGEASAAFTIDPPDPGPTPPDPKPTPPGPDPTPDPKPAPSPANKAGASAATGDGLIDFSLGIMLLAIGAGCLVVYARKPRM